MKSGAQIIEVSAALAPQVIEALKKEINEAITHTVGETLDADDLAAIARTGKAQLFAAIVDDDIVGVVVCEVLLFPKRRICQGIVVAGKRGTFGKWAPAMRAHVDDWAQRLDCEYVISVGRRGWLREAKRYGYKTEKRTFIVKKLKP